MDTQNDTPKQQVEQRNENGVEWQELDLTSPTHNGPRFATVQLDEKTGLLNRIVVEKLDPEHSRSARMRITFFAARPDWDDPGEDRVAAVLLNWDDLDSFVHMLQRAR